MRMFSFQDAANCALCSILSASCTTFAVWMPKKMYRISVSFVRALTRLMDENIASNLLNIPFKKNGSVASYTVNEQKKDTMLQTAGFFASKTVWVDFTPLEAMDNYGMRDDVKSKFSAYNFKKIRIPQFSETRFGSFVGLFSCFYVYKQ